MMMLMIIMIPNIFPLCCFFIRANTASKKNANPPNVGIRDIYLLDMIKPHNPIDIKRVLEKKAKMSMISLKKSLFKI